METLRRLCRIVALVTLVTGWGPTALVAQDQDTPEVLVVPIRDEIGLQTVALVNRAMRSAASRGVRWVVLDIDTPGGRAGAMKDTIGVLSSIRAGGAQVIAYVRSKALSAGGYIALACDETYMAPGARLGAITPVFMTPFGIQSLEGDVRRKLLSSMRAEVRGLIERRDNLPAYAGTIAEALVDPTMEVFEVTYVDKDGFDVTSYVDGQGLEDLEGSGIRIQNRRSLGETPLTLTAEEALQFGFSSGTLDSLDDLARDVLHVDANGLSELRPSFWESSAVFLESMKPILFILGFILLLLEMKAPGTIVPGALGVTMIGLGLFSSYLVGLAEWTEILLFVLGLGLIAAELFLVPGTILAGLAGFLTLTAALILSQQTFVWPSSPTEHEVFAANLRHLLWLVLILIAVVIGFWRYVSRLPYFNRLQLRPPEQSMTGDSTRWARANAAPPSDLSGSRGVADTDLRPAGAVLFGEDRRDVVSGAGFIARGTPVRVVEVSGNRIVVEADAESGATHLSVLLLLLLVGVLLAIAEVFFVSFGVLGIAAAASLFFAAFLAFEHGTGWGVAFLIVEVIGTPLAIVWAFKMLPRIGLQLRGPSREEVAGAAQEPGLEVLLGRTGVAESPLRPTGFARIDGRRIDVVSRGEPIEPGQPIKVLEVEANRIVVGPSSGDEASANAAPASGGSGAAPSESNPSTDGANS